MKDTKQTTNNIIPISPRGKNKTKQTNLCSVTGVNPPRTHGLGVWNSERVVVGIRCDKKLYEAFKPVAKAVFGSVCRPIESFMATVVSTIHNNKLDKQLGVNPRLTIDIGKVVIERNVRSRRKLVVEEETETTLRKSVDFKTVMCEICHDKSAEFKAFERAVGNSMEKRVAFYCKDCMKGRLKHNEVLGHRRLEAGELHG